MVRRGLAARAKVFIDGEAGTTGLGIRERLRGLEKVDLLAIDPAQRKDGSARAALMESADLVVLCLPDEAAKEAVALAGTPGGGGPRILDASTAHRTAEGWVYGFAEMAPDQRRAIADAGRVANPGCYATAVIALLRPLVDAGLMPADHALTINAISGFSGGGRTMIESYAKGDAPPFELYALDLAHKHLPEIMAYSGLTRRPVFVPSVGNFRQGMLVSIPLHLDTLPRRISAPQLEKALMARYAGSETVTVVPGKEHAHRLATEEQNGTDRLELRVFASRTHPHAVLVARLDNLGKGASGAAVQNIRLMLGLERP